MKCIYTESDITKSACQLLVSPISLDALYTTSMEREFQRCFPEATKVARQMLTKSTVVTEDMLPHMSDVIWVDTPGGRTTGFCIVRETRDDHINKKALRAGMKSVNRKAGELGQPVIGLDLFGCETAEDWAEIVDLIEEELNDVQVVVCIPTNKLLNEVIDILPGDEEIKVLSLSRE